MKWSNLIEGLLPVLCLCTQYIAVQGNQPAELSGLITDLFGQPLSGARIEISREGLEELQYVKADTWGRYRIRVIQPGQYTVTAIFSGFRQEKKRIVLSNSTKTVILNFGLEPGALHDSFPFLIEGVASSADNHMVKEINVSIINAFNHRLSAEAVTNDQGEYKLNVDSPGLYIMYATGPGYKPVLMTVTLTALLPRLIKKIDITIEK